ncbi:intermembrane lipid transfer protein Vps13D [Anopheles bellator]|uniref:intermembrane lipid transfer protein Vps13D n=1 Tax=Anopheles bellator TaxID=139047 RepID=UPI002648F42B|nr:intermembrane lipid transfer protein Vps13D [Anopheles bellator]
MLRELIAWVLNNYLGKYVENLNTAQLTIALLSGQVELENLPLRKDALRHFGLPLQIVSGSIGKVKLTVPVRAFRTASWCLYIDNVNVTCGPIDLEQNWNAEAEQQTEHDLKVASLDRIEAKWRAQRETPVTEGSYYASSYSGWLNYGTSLVTNIVENLQLTVNGIHIRYEDGLTIPQQRFACGIKIDALSAQSCDDGWVPGRAAPNWASQQLTFKLVELTNFTVYWDPRAVDETVHIISPISVRAQLQRDRSETPLRTRSRPRLVCDLIWEEIKIVLSDIQYNQMMQCVRGLDDIARYRRFKLLRPVGTVREDPRAWWRYAVRCHGLCRHLGVTDPYEVARDNLQYIRIYTRVVANPNEVLSSTHKQFKDRIERERTFDELRLLRDVCMAQLPSLAKSIVTTGTSAGGPNQGKTMLVHFFPQWWGWYSNNNNNASATNGAKDAPGGTPPGAGDDDNFPAMLLQATDEQSQLLVASDGTPNNGGANEDLSPGGNSFEDEILNALAGSVESNSLLKRDAVFGKFQFILKRGTLDFCAALEMTPKLQFLFHDLKMDVESRPRSGSHYVGLSLGSIRIKDRLTPNSQFPDLVKPQQKEEGGLLLIQQQMAGSGGKGVSFSTATPPAAGGNRRSLPTDATIEPIFQIQYERKPLSHDTDCRLMVKSKSLDIVYNMDAVRWLVDFLVKPHQQYDARRRLEDMKNKTKQELMRNWNYIIEGHLSERTTWTLEFDICAPQIIFVDNFADRTNSTIIVVDFGRLQLTNGGDRGLSPATADGGNAAMAATGDPVVAKGGSGTAGGRTESSWQRRDATSTEVTENDEDDAFMTPCSTPPGSEASTTNSPTLVSAFSDPGGNDRPVGGAATAQPLGVADTLNEYQLYQRLYDRYHLQLTDLQVLVCHAKERWTAASQKGTSNLHVLDRFSIVLQVERRVVYTNDPQYPSLTLSGTLPKLNAHINEYKVSSILMLVNKLTRSATMPPQSGWPAPTTVDDESSASAAKSRETNAARQATESAITANSNGGANEKDESATDGVQNRDAMTNIVVFQFTIDQMSLEVQSRGRSVAELQVSGVKAGYSQRPEDISLTLSVHGLLLVDAMQSFGQDFELLIASHRHVGMDSLSGSLRQSEPCSPCSPASPPDPNVPGHTIRPTSPLTISKALSNLQRATSPIWNAAWTPLGDLDALITVEVVFVTAERAEDRLQVANIQFNNLDIIANQETIVELLGFIKRVIPTPMPAPPEQSGHSFHGGGFASTTTESSEASHVVPPAGTSSRRHSDSISSDGASPVRLEITFDFHRLNVLVLRALIRDNYLVGRKVGTFTMSEAKIHATLGIDITVEGSLGGLQVLDLTPEGVNHQRILSVGKDPLTEAATTGASRLDTDTGGQPDLMTSLAQEVYGMAGPKRDSSPTACGTGSIDQQHLHDERQALSFRVSKDLNACIDIRVQMASVWFIHCARFMQELSWCATEFKHYLKNLARSIRDKATDMALGLVQSRTDLSSSRPESSYASPRRVRRQRTVSLSRTQDVLLNADYTLKVDITLETPVLILPRSSSSPQVLVAHLGRITVSNKPEEDVVSTAASHERIVINLTNTPPGAASGYRLREDDGADRTSIDCNLSDLDGLYDPPPFDGNLDGGNSGRIRFAKDDSTEFIDSLAADGGGRGATGGTELDRYQIDFRNINLYSLDTTNRKGGFRFAGLPRAEEFYSCKENAIPIIHDTIFSLEIWREQQLGGGADFASEWDEASDGFRIVGCVVKPLRLSLKRQQYEQLLETIDNLFAIPKDLVRPPSEVPATLEKVTELAEESSFHTFPLPTKVRQGLFYQAILEDQRGAPGGSAKISIRVNFELPAFIIQLNGNRNEALVQISFRDFCVDFDKRTQYETHVKISLRSLLMEDLLQSDTAKNRYMVVSSAERDSVTARPSGSSFASHSCPNLVGLLLANMEGLPNSLPTNLEDKTGFAFLAANKSLCPDTPPPSPSVQRPEPGVRLDPEENLVIYSSVIVDPACPTFATQFGSMQQSSLIDFNALDLIVSVESWFVLLDFFGLLSDDTDSSNGEGSGASQKPESRSASSQPGEKLSDNSQRDCGANSSFYDNSEPFSGGAAASSATVGQSKLEISVRSLSLVLAKPTYEIAKANVSNAQLTISKRGQAKQVEGSLGSITLSDLTPFGMLYRDKFATTGTEALNFVYVRDAIKGTTDGSTRGLQKDAQLTIAMSSVRYIHTKRFIAEIQLFFKEFSHLQTPMMRKIKPADARAYHNQRPTQLGLAINAGAPIILLPMSYNSHQVIVADLGEFRLTNEFRLSAGECEVLDVMHVNLFHTDIFAARMEEKPDDRFIPVPTMASSASLDRDAVIDMRGYRLVKKGPSLLKEKCHLKLEVERNLDSLNSHSVPDITVYGTLSKLDALLDLQQYRLIRGFLSYNLGEEIDELYLRAFSIPNSTLSLNAADATSDHPPEDVWKNLSIHLELLDVSVRLVQTLEDTLHAQTKPLACVNFIKSKLLVDCFSDGAQDIDLVSQEIQLIDTRFLAGESNGSVMTGGSEVQNVFPNVLQPIRGEPGTELVQAEIHSRRRRDLTKFTILLNNMRLMAILDWLENARDFILQQEDPPPTLPSAVMTDLLGDGGPAVTTAATLRSSPIDAARRIPTPAEESRMELKLNITDSELVFVEKTDQLDTNAVILKSTTVVSYRPFEVNKTLSINLNNLEVFSCILGAEERTALSIIDPVTINMDVKKGVLEIQMQKQLCIRLSYHDVRMFRQMLESLPEQTKNARHNRQQLHVRRKDTANEVGSPSVGAGGEISRKSVEKLVHLGFRREDCLLALEHCSHQLDEAALWLTQNKEPARRNDDVGRSLSHSNSVGSGTGGGGGGAISIKALELKSPCISICVIDDCRDADVPLVELSLSKLDLRQDLAGASVYGPTVEELSVPANGAANVLPVDVGEDPLGATFSGFNAGRIAGVFAIDYYNRVLSGWEPMIEPWKVEAKWGQSLAIGDGAGGSGLRRLNMRVESNDTLRLNVTSTLIELIALVKDNWMQDLYVDAPPPRKPSGDSSLSASASFFRQRAPFVPFALKNDTGVRLWYTTLISSELISSHGRNTISSLPNVPPEAQWTLVEPGGGLSTFSYGTRHKARHRDSHKVNLHQIAVRVEGWQEVGPMSVDRVGTYFRHARPDLCSGAAADYAQMPRARIVFGVTMEGSAQKLITVRSALKLVNKLDQPVLVKLEHLYGHLNIRHWPDTKTLILHSNELLNVPLTHVHAVLYFRPLVSHAAAIGAGDHEAIVGSNTRSVSPVTVPGVAAQVQSQHSSSSDGWTLLQRFDVPKVVAHNGFQFTDRGVQWSDAIEPGELYQELRSCRGPRDKMCKLLLAIRKEPYPAKELAHLPGHVITIWPPVRIHNLLPCDLLYRLPSGSQGRISSSETARITEVDIEQPIVLTVTLDSYPNPGQITIPAGTYGSTTLDVRLFDVCSRMLRLSATIVVVRGRGVQISIGAPYWLVNRTGLPLVFRQDDLDAECAGQFSENEQARMITPFMFAFSDPGCSGAVTMRLGRRFGNQLQWCQPFKLEQGTQHRQLIGASETFIIGVEVRRARGKYGQTSIVTFSPRYQLYNRSSYTLQVLQKCLVSGTTVYDPAARGAYIEAVPGCHIPFHWPRLDREHELCVRLPEVPECLWSGGIPIAGTGLSLYINIRNMNGVMHFLRLETILQGATYFMVFSNAQALPPPIRLDNYSHVPITFHQADGGRATSTFKTIVRPHSSIAYVLDEPTGAPYLQLEAPGGDYSNCRLDGFEPFRLMYENFIYIAFSQTFTETPGAESGTPFTGRIDHQGTVAGFDVRAQQLVLGVVDGGRVVLVRKHAGDRSQLWRMNNEMQLEHEGTSPPSEPGKKQRRYVLDLEKPPQPMQFIGLVVRPANRQRQSTQTWRFTEDGRLMCDHANMCVQARGGFFGLHAGSEAVLGMCVADTKVLTACGVPFEQAIERQKLRPGSGCLSVAYRMDGPIKSIQIRDVKAGDIGGLSLDASWKHVSHIFTTQSSSTQDADGEEPSAAIQAYHVQLNLRKGIGLSLISNQPCEEIAYMALENIHMECIRSPAVNTLDFSVGDMQIDNQLFETSCPIMLYTIGASGAADGTSVRRSSAGSSSPSSLQLNVRQLPSPNTNAVIFEHFILSIRPIAVYLEERLFLRLVKFFGFAKATVDPTTLPDETDYEAQKIIYKVLDSNVKRYYFGDLRIIPSQIRLSFVTASKLTAEFAEIKRNLGFTFIKFEDAVINFDQFAHKYHFETLDAYLNAIRAHYKQELKWHAASILGSVDFLGNPLGFANDLSEGFSGLLLEGSISSLVKNVTHGISNSTAKLTETISDGLGKVVFDDEHVETRQRILDVSGGGGSGSGTTGDHLVAGFRGFTFGLLGGVTSIVKHTYQGTANDGLSGFITGLGKGLVGTVTKPVIGVLDLASETANAVREQSKGSNRILPERKRLPRTVTGAPGGLLPPYSYLQSTGQHYLFLINKRNFSEQFLAYEPCLLDTKDSKMRLLVTAENVWGFSKNGETTMIVFHYPMSEIISCHPETTTTGTSVPGMATSERTGNETKTVSKRPPITTTYIEFCLSLPSKSSLTPSAPEMVKRPRVRCQNEEIAKKICYHVNFAKCIYDEREQTLNINPVIE